MIVCTKCNQEKSEVEFKKESTRKSGYSGRCKECLKKPAKPGASWARHIKHQYGIVEDDYSTMFANQGGRCAICQSTPDSPLGKLSIDHCHDSKKVRGLLCSKCNKGLGLFSDSVAHLQQAIDYLKTTG